MGRKLEVIRAQKNRDAELGRVLYKPTNGFRFHSADKDFEYRINTSKSQNLLTPRTQNKNEQTLENHFE